MSGGNIQGAHLAGAMPHDQDGDGVDDDDPGEMKFAPLHIGGAPSYDEFERFRPIQPGVDFSGPMPSAKASVASGELPPPLGRARARSREHLA
ncbi:hypothetical protein NXC14_PA00064 (plasmid) [Rhizobium sp. NXC14]|nr:hypothetical protein NXC14_PA00064 [Rhizobium sp. NXC14]